MPYTFTCKHCGRSFTNKNKDVVYCSKDCYSAGQVGKPSGKLIKNYVGCQQCGASFRARPAAHRKFCSRKCKDTSLIGKPGKKPGSQTVQCIQCGVSFKAPQSNARQFCSTTCYDNSRRKPKVDKLCDHCGKPFQSFPSDTSARFCSTACRYSHLSGDRNSRWKPSIALTCEQCGGVFDRKPWQSHIRFCSRKCRNYWLRNNIISPTGIEIAIEAVLQSMGITFEPQAQLEKWSCDFFVPGANLVIECDGDYWHSLPRMQRKDAIKDQWLQDHGYQVLHLSERDINQDIEQCKDRIRLALLCPVHQ